MNRVFGLVNHIDSRHEFSKNGSRPIFAAKRHENSMKPIFRRINPTIRRTAFLLLISMLLSVFTGYSYTASAEDLTEAEQTTVQTENVWTAPYFEDATILNFPNGN